jgi:cytochrome bd ubiquinol oxidase subunit II
METLWFILVAAMLVMYVILDGFDLGAGIIHLWVAKTNEERRAIIKTIGPVWDGNEVWLLAAGGTLYFAFPLLYASSFSGFYLPLTMVLWLLMLRGVGIEFRAHLEGPVWKSFFDGIFSLSSALLAIFFGAALGNVVRGVPLQADGYFFEPLWTNFAVGPNAGVLDWYTVLIGVFAFLTLALHGAHYVAAKTEGEVNIRARQAASKMWWGVTLLTVASLPITLSIRPELYDNYKAHWFGWLIPVVTLAGLVGMFYFRSLEKDKAAFVSSSAYIAGMLGGAAFGLYPNVLPASTDPRYNLSVHNTASGHYGLSVGLVWWTIGMVLATGYFIYLYRLFGGKVNTRTEGY